MATPDHQCSNFEEIEALVGGQDDSYLSTAYKCIECGSLFLPESDEAGEQQQQQQSSAESTQADELTELPDEQAQQQLQHLLQKESGQGDAPQGFTPLEYSTSELSGTVTQQSLQSALFSESRGNAVSLLQNNSLLMNDTIAQLAAGQANLKEEPLDLADVKLEHQSASEAQQHAQQHAQNNVNISLKNELQNFESDQLASQENSTTTSTEQCIFLCEICSTPTGSKEAFVEHMMSVHNAIVPADEDSEICTCGTCGAKFKSQADILQHVGDTHPLPADSSGQIFKCSSCSTYFTTEGSLYAHACPGDPDVDEDQQVDNEDTENEESSTINFIEDSDQDEGVIIQSVQYKDGNVKYFDVKYKKVFLTDGKMLCQCKQCHYTTGDSKALIEHHRTVHMHLQEYVCGVCNDTFTWKPLYETHMERYHAKKEHPLQQYLTKGRPPHDSIKRKPHLKTYKTQEETTKALYNNSICEFCFWKCKDRIDLHQHVLKRHKQGSLDLMDKWLEHMRVLEDDGEPVQMVDTRQSMVVYEEPRKMGQAMLTNTRVKTSPYCAVGRPRKRMVNRTASYVDPDSQLIALAESSIDVSVDVDVVRRRKYSGLPSSFSAQFPVEEYQIQVGLPNGVCDVFYSIESLGMREALIIRPEKEVDYDYVIVEPPLNEKEIICELCRKIYKPSISSNPGLLFVCKLCVSNKVFVEENHLACHLDHAHPFQMNKARCPFCPDLIFHAQDEFYTHVKKGHPEKGTSHCYLCSLINYRGSNLSLHIDRHLQMRGDGSHSCPICDQQFNSANVLNTHVVKFHPSAMKVYDELYMRKHRCVPCNQNFRFEGSLTMHKSIGSCIDTGDESIQVDIDVNGSYAIRRESNDSSGTAEATELNEEEREAVQMIIEAENNQEDESALQIEFVDENGAATENETPYTETNAVSEAGQQQIGNPPSQPHIPHVVGISKVRENVSGNIQTHETPIENVKVSSTSNKHQDVAEGGKVETPTQVVVQGEGSEHIVEDPLIIRALEEGRAVALNPETGRLELVPDEQPVLEHTSVNMPTSEDGPSKQDAGEAQVENKNSGSEETNVEFIQPTASETEQGNQQDKENQENIVEGNQQGNQNQENIVEGDQQGKQNQKNIVEDGSQENRDNVVEGGQQENQNPQNVFVDDTNNENHELLRGSNIVDSVGVQQSENMQLKSGGINVESGAVHLGSGESQLEPPCNQMESGDGQMESVGVQLESNTHMESNTAQLGESDVQLETGGVQLESGRVLFESGSVQSESATNQLESGCSQMGSSGVQLESNAEQIEQDGVQLESDKITFESGGIQFELGDQMSSSDTVRVGSGDIQFESGGVQLIEGNLVIPTSNLPGDTPPIVTIEVLDKAAEGGQMMEVEVGDAPEEMDTAE